MKRLYDDKVKDTLCGYILKGETPKAVSERCDVAAEVLRRWCRERDITWAKEKPKYDPELVKQILLDIQAGKTTIAQSSRKHKISESALQRACRKYGIRSKGRGKNLETGYKPLEVVIKVSRQDLLHNWKRSEELFTYIPKARKWNYIREFLYR